MTMSTKDWNYWLTFAKEQGVMSTDIYYSDASDDPDYSVGPDPREARLWDQVASADDPHNYMMIDLSGITGANSRYGDNDAYRTANHQWVSENWGEYVVDAGYDNEESWYLVINYVLDDPQSDDPESDLTSILDQVGSVLESYPCFDDELAFAIEEEWKVRGLANYMEDWAADGEPLAEVPYDKVEELANWTLWYAESYQSSWFTLEYEDLIIPDDDVSDLQELALAGYRAGMPYDYESLPLKELDADLTR